jgi:hypothetical protein
MAHNNTVLSQMLQLLPKHIFDHVADLYLQRWQIDPFSLDQTKPQDQGVLRDLRECRAHPNLGRHDRLPPAPVAEGEKLGGWSILDLTRLAQTLIMERCNL